MIGLIILISLPSVGLVILIDFAEGFGIDLFRLRRIVARYGLWLMRTSGERDETYGH